MDETDLGRQHLIQAIADDRMRLATADLHDIPRPGNDPGDGLGKAPRGDGVAILLAELHEGCPARAVNSASISPIAARCSKTRWASASSITVIAKPAWTST